MASSEATTLKIDTSSRATCYLRVYLLCLCNLHVSRQLGWFVLCQTSFSSHSNTFDFDQLALWLFSFFLFGVFSTLISYLQMHHLCQIAKHFTLIRSSWSCSPPRSFMVHVTCGCETLTMIIQGKLGLASLIFVTCNFDDSAPGAELSQSGEGRQGGFPAELAIRRRVAPAFCAAQTQ